MFKHQLISSVDLRSGHRRLRQVVLPLLGSVHHGLPLQQGRLQRSDPEVPDGEPRSQQRERGGLYQQAACLTKKNAGGNSWCQKMRKMIGIWSIDFLWWVKQPQVVWLKKRTPKIAMFAGSYLLSHMDIGQIEDPKQPQGLVEVLNHLSHTSTQNDFMWQNQNWRFQPIAQRIRCDSPSKKKLLINEFLLADPYT